MRLTDLLKISAVNLWRRKLRTFLTVLGVIIGTASIVVMISLGLGLSRATMKQIEENGGLTTINVYPNYSGDTTEGDAGRIKDSTAEEIAGISHVEVATPVLGISMIAKCGSYEGYITLYGMSAEALEKMDVPLGKGATLPTDPDQLEILYGNQAITDFYNARTNEYYWETGELPDIDLAKDPVFYILDTDRYWEAKNGSTDENGVPVTMPKKYMLPSAGVTEGSVDDYHEFSWNAYCNLDALKTTLKKEFKNRAVPGQPTNTNGKPYKEWYYDELRVIVDDMENVASVQKAIVDMGYSAYSNAEWVSQMEEQYATTQAVLGGIGAVSLFVAAIGIANTMMMSIYERTKEIGIMKVLGCGLGRIRDMFLMEAAYIGLLGGVLGLCLSYGISQIINHFLAQSMGYPEGISYIPIWLAGAALIFSVLIGMQSRDCFLHFVP